MRSLLTHRANLIMIAALLMAALACLAMPLSRALQARWMGVMHLDEPNVAAWVAVQAMPKMYNFANQLWWSELEISDAHLAGEALTGEHDLARWMNHYPMWYFTANPWMLERHRLKTSRSALVVRSRFRGYERVTRWRVSAPREPSGRASQLRLERADAP